MARILAKTVDGPLNGMFFSVADDQETIEGFNEMPEGSRYNKQSDTLRDFEGEEAGLVANLFDQAAHNLKQVCEFVYNENPS